MPAAVKALSSSLLTGLPTFFGGKRKIARLIAKLAQGTRFCDLFMGGGSIALYLKAQGFEIQSCDRSYLSQIVGQALIGNDSKTVHPSELQSLFVPQTANTFCLENYFPALFTERHAAWIDDAVHAADQFKDETTKSLLKLVIAKTIFHLRAFGAFTNQLYMTQWNNQDEEGLLHRSGGYYKNLGMTTWELARKSADEVNASVFPNGRVNRFAKIDVMDFLDHNRPIDTIYLDPPYHGSQNYEGYYSIVNRILTGGAWQTEPVSEFNKQETYFDAIRRVVSKCHDIPRMLFSYGGYKGISERDRLVELIQTIRGASIDLLEIPYSYSIHRTNGNGSNAPEFLIVSDL